MVWFTKWALRNRAAVILLIVLTLGLGTLSYFTLPKELLPAADNPMVTVIVIGQGADAETVEEQVTKPIEKAIGAVKGKKHVFSTSADGYTSVDIFLDPSVDLNEAKVQVQEALSGLQLPEGYSEPIVSQLNFDMIPLWQIGLSFPNGIKREEMEMIENEVVPTFQGIAGVADVAVYGSQQTQVTVKPDHEKMASYQMPVQSLIGILQGKNLAVAVGEETINEKKTNIKVIGQIKGVKELEELQIAPNIQLKDIATVAVTDSSSTFITRVNGEEAVAVLLYKDSNANAVAIGKKVTETIAQINEDFPSIKASMLISFSEFIVQSVDSMMTAVLMGALFATIIIFLFLRHFRMTLITVVSIPLSLGLTLFLLSQSGVTLNLLTIGAVAVAVGRLVDDSIVVIENIFRKAQNGDFSKDVIVNATKEVSAAITASTLTTVAVFLPMGLVKSLQDLLLPFALTITYALLSSLLVALTVVPLMSTRLMKKGKLPVYRKPKTYLRILTWCLRHKWVPLVLSFIIFVGSIGMYAFMPKGAEDAGDNDVSIMLEYPDEIPFTNVQDEVFELEKFLKEQSVVEEVILFLGSNPEDAQFSSVNSQNMGRFHVVMKEKADTEKFVEKVNSKVKEYSDAKIDVEVLASLISFTDSTITLDVVGKDASKLIQASDEIMDVVNDIQGVEKVSSNQNELKSVYEIIVNQKKANTEEVARQVQFSLNPFPIGSIKVENKDTEVMLDSSISLTSEADLKKLTIVVNEELVPLSSIAKLEKLTKPTSVLRKDGNEYVRISVDVDSGNLSGIANEITEKTTHLTLPEGVSLEAGGAASAQDEQFMELFQLMIVSIGLVYLIMVLTFKTLRAPLVILFTLPLAMIGAVLGLLISRTPIDIGAMLGALMLIGIVVTNAIVLLDRVRQNEEKMPIREALLEAGATRFRPILMTALATIFAMLPLLFGKEEMGSILVSKGLAVVVIGGLAVATLLTLVIIPVVYELFHFRKAKSQRLAKNDSQL